jgi:NAD+ kinase
LHGIFIKNQRGRKHDQKTNLMKVAIYSRGNGDGLKEELEELASRLISNGIEVLLHFSLQKFIKQHPLIQFFAGHEELNDSVDFLISIGGDGTILDTVTLVRNKNIPILGINYGRLGFLAGISKNEINLAVDALVNRRYVN